MIRYYEGTVFNSSADAFVNTINTVGVMGAGIALEFALRYPKMFDDYKLKCESKQLKVGKVDYYQDEILIVNFPTKWHFKYPSQIEWIEQGLIDFKNTYKNYNFKSIAFPRLGCANGGLHWEMVKPLMEKYLSDLDVEVIICLDQLSYAEGKEKEMVEKFNRTSIDEISQYVRLNSKQKELIALAQPITRFWKLQKIKGLGITTYSKLFNLFYDSNFEPSEQISLF